MSVTVVLPTDQPAAKVARWLEYARRTAFPFPIVAASTSHDTKDDATRASGSVRRARVAGQTLFKDALTCLELVGTPYVMLLDPGDFAVPNGLARIVRFLDLHPTYICAGGLTVCYQGIGVPRQEAAAVLPFAAAPGWRWPEPLWHRLPRDTRNDSPSPEAWWAAFRPLDLDHSTAERRVAAFGQNYRPLYGFVFRIGELRRILAELVLRECGSALLSEMLLAWQAAVRGRIHLYAAAIAVVAPALRLAHYADCHVAYDHFLDPTGMDGFHRATAELGEKMSAASSAEDVKPLLSRLAGQLDVWRRQVGALFGLDSSPAPAVLGRAPFSDQGAVAPPIEPERYVESDGENKIRASMGNFVAQLSRNEVAVLPEARSEAFAFLADQLRDFGVSEGDVERLLTDLAIVRESVLVC